MNSEHALIAWGCLDGAGTRPYTNSLWSWPSVVANDGASAIAMRSEQACTARTHMRREKEGCAQKGSVGDVAMCDHGMAHANGRR